jgi:outer membrane biosynthesis protein TonB
VAELDHCPTCGEPAERGQLVCLNCGGRIALDYRRPGGWSPAAAIVLAVVAIGAGLSGWAIAELTSDPQQEVALVESTESTPTDTRETTAEKEPKTETETAPQPKAETQPKTETQPEPPPTPKPKPSGAATGWPEGVTANTVVLVTSSDKAGAQKVADQAAKSGLEAGLIPSDPYDLGEGLWVVYSGRYPTREAAAAEASKLQGRYPGAYPQLIRSP